VHVRIDVAHLALHAVDVVERRAHELLSPERLGFVFGAVLRVNGESLVACWLFLARASDVWDVTWRLFVG
jgi:hypothetical protein